MPPNKRREPVPSDLGLRCDVHDDAFRANAYLLGRLVHMGRTVSPRLPTLCRARTFWREVIAFKHSYAYTKKIRTSLSLVYAFPDLQHPILGHTYLLVFRDGPRDQTPSGREIQWQYFCEQRWA